MNAIEIAIKMEKDAIDFYREAAGRVRHPVGKKMFLSITEDEKRHLQMLSQIFKEIDIKLENVSPMKNMQTVFQSMKDAMMQKVAASKDELEAFKIAMQYGKRRGGILQKGGGRGPGSKRKGAL